MCPIIMAHEATELSGDVDVARSLSPPFFALYELGWLERAVKQRPNQGISPRGSRIR